MAVNNKFSHAISSFKRTQNPHVSITSSLCFYCLCIWRSCCFSLVSSISICPVHTGLFSVLGELDLTVFVICSLPSLQRFPSESMSDLVAINEAWRLETDSSPHYISYRRSIDGPTLGRAVLPAKHRITSVNFGGVEHDHFIFLLTPRQWLRPCPTCSQHFHNEHWLRRHYCFPAPIQCRAPAAVPIPQFISSPSESPTLAPAQPSSSSSSSSLSPSSLALPSPPPVAPLPQHDSVTQPPKQLAIGSSVLVKPRLVQAEREAIAFGVKEAIRKCPPAITTFIRAQCDLLFVTQLVSTFICLFQRLICVHDSTFFFCRGRL